MVTIRPPRFEGAFQLTERRRLGYAEYGPATGRPVLWFHGCPGGRRQIAPRAREVADERGVRLIAVERPGIGGSTPHAYRFLVDWAKDVEAFCDGLGLERFAVAGLSGGGPYTLACARRMPRRVVAVALLGGVAPTRGPDAAPGGITPLADVMRWGVGAARAPLSVLFPRLVPALEPWGERAMDAFASFMPPGDQLVFQDPGIREMFLEDIMLASRRHMQAFLYDAILFGRHWGFALGDVRVPVHMWYGDADVIVPVTHGEHMAERIPGATLRIRPEEGHLGGLGASDEIFDVLLGHFDEEDRTSSAGS